MGKTESFLEIAMVNVTASLKVQGKLLDEISSQCFIHAKRLDNLPKLPGLPNLGSSVVFRDLAEDMDLFTAGMYEAWKDYIPGLEAFERQASYEDKNFGLTLREIDLLSSAAKAALEGVTAFRDSARGLEKLSPILQLQARKMNVCLDKNVELTERAIAAFEALRGRVR